MLVASRTKEEEDEWDGGYEFTLPELIVICEIRILLFLTHEWQCKLLKWPFDIIIAVKRRKANTEGQDYVNEVAMPKVGLPYILQSSCRSSIIFPGTTSQIVL